MPTDTGDVASGTLDVKAFLADLVTRGRIGDTGNAADKTDPRVGQISFGVEPVSTNGASRHWDFGLFTVVDR